MSIPEVESVTDRPCATNCRLALELDTIVLGAQIGRRADSLDGMLNNLIARVFCEEPPVAPGCGATRATPRDDIPYAAPNKTVDFGNEELKASHSWPRRV